LRSYSSSVLFVGCFSRFAQLTPLCPRFFSFLLSLHLYSAFQCYDEQFFYQFTLHFFLPFRPPCIHSFPHISCRSPPFQSFLSRVFGFMFEFAPFCYFSPYSLADLIRFSWSWISPYRSREPDPIRPRSSRCGVLFFVLLHCSSYSSYFYFSFFLPPFPFSAVIVMRFHALVFS